MKRKLFLLVKPDYIGIQSEVDSSPTFLGRKFAKFLDFSQIFIGQKLNEFWLLTAYEVRLFSHLCPVISEFEVMHTSHLLPYMYI